MHYALKEGAASIVHCALCIVHYKEFSPIPDLRSSILAPQALLNPLHLIFLSDPRSSIPLTKAA